MEIAPAGVALASVMPIWLWNLAEKFPIGCISLFKLTSLEWALLGASPILLELLVRVFFNLLTISLPTCGVFCGLIGIVGEPRLALPCGVALRGVGDADAFYAHLLF